MKTGPPVFPVDVLRWYEWFWIVYVGIATFSLGMYTMVLFLEGNARKRVQLTVLSILLIVVSILVALTPIQLLNGHPKMVAYVEESRKYFV